MSALMAAPVNSRLTIEMVLPTLYKAGMEVMAARLSRGLAGLGHDVGFTCIEGGGALADELSDQGYRVLVVPAPGVRSLMHAPELTTWLAARRPDVVHVHTGAWLKAARAARRAGVRRVVHTEHGLFEGEPWHRTALNRCAAHFTDHVVAVAEPIRAYLTSRVGVQADKVSVIRNGVDTNLFSPGTGMRTPGPPGAPGALRARLGIPLDAPLIGNVARLDAVKNHALLLRAFAIVHAQMPASRLVVVGEGTLRRELEASVATLGLRDRVHLVGEISDVASIYREFDLFVLSSTIEGTSMSILEAMATGTCVVATAVGGNPELLGYGTYGALVPSNDAGALAAAVTRLLRESRERGELAAAARQRVAAQYSETAMVRAYEALYRGGRSSECAA